MKPVLIALLLTLPIYIKGQVCLSDILPASADSLEKCRIRHFTPGKGGKNKVWDFSGKLKSRESSQCFFDGGYCQFTQSDNDFDSAAESLSMYYYNQDHLGNIREVVDADGDVVQVTNYYPIGTPYSDSSATLNPNHQKHKFKISTQSYNIHNKIT